MMVVTRTQAMRQLQEETTTRSKEHELGAKPHRISRSVGGADMYRK